MRVVTRRALHRALAHRHVTEAIVLVHDRLVAGRARLHLGLPDQLRRPLRLMDAVTGDAADVAAVVLAAIPERVRAAVMARRADLAGLLRLQLLRVADQRRIAAVGVRLARPVTAFTPVRRGWRPLVEREAMLGALVTLVVVAPHAGLFANVVAGGYWGR